jgi:hypothetical protein
MFAAAGARHTTLTAVNATLTGGEQGSEKN